MCPPPLLCPDRFESVEVTVRAVVLEAVPGGIEQDCFEILDRVYERGQACRAQEQPIDLKRELARSRPDRSGLGDRRQ